METHRPVGLGADKNGVRAVLDKLPGERVVTANNVTYAVAGDSFKYWDFFPAPEGFGIVPMWGHARVIENAASAGARSIAFDAVLEDAKRVQNGLTKTDIDKLDEYYQSIRDIEVRLGKDEQWLSVPKSKPPVAEPKPPVAEPKPGLAGKAEIEVMYDLIVAALQTDSTRVLTYRQPVGTLLQSLGTKVAPHDMSHYSPGDRMAASQKRDATQSELLAGLIDKLKATKEADGTSLFDHVALAYGSNIRTIHYLDNCPTLLTGGAANLKLGHHLVLPKDTPLCNVWLTMLNGLGIEAERHGDSTGVVKELMG